MKKKTLIILILAVLVLLGVWILRDKEQPAKIGGNTEEAPKGKVSAEVAKTNVENYLRENISELSPTKAVLGGKWYVVAVETNLDTNSGTVTYEDGHIQEKRNFVYTVDDRGEVTSLTIK